ncbi:hypothetical protein COLO4_35554 [Corchorus olitorius]|uniref:Uncharacterized protein n=1 Tax=Corchorus olitorius TaxID=93759 RepID=A0A1R3GFF2_9ROSI|nr:hypothetical protein COLO4_35554 [Corchorus olitorius]
MAANSKETEEKSLLNEVTFMTTTSEREKAQEVQNIGFAITATFTSPVHIPEFMLTSLVENLRKKKRRFNALEMPKDRRLMEKLKRRVQEAVKAGVSSSLKTSTIVKRFSPTVMKPIGDAFRIMERNGVDLRVIRGLTTNGIPLLKNPQFHEFVAAL